jgi:hypothetical protein
MAGEAFGFRYRWRTVSARNFGPLFIPEFLRILKTHAAAATAVLEWGSGLTTQMLLRHLAQQPDAQLLLTIDTNAAYQQAVLAKCLRPAFLDAVALDLTGPRRPDGADPELNYSAYPSSLGRTFDFIVIDGRRRVECALNAALVSHAGTIVVLHDYRRRRYQAARTLFDIVEDGPEFLVMRPKVDVMAALALQFGSTRAARFIEQER